MSVKKERPILFNGAMVRAILEGRKTVTRRALRNQLENGWHLHPETPLAEISSAHPKKGRFGALIRRELSSGSGRYEHDVIPSPYGQPGDRLWVRESWAADAQVDSVSPGELSQGEPICYLADCDVRSTGCAMVTLGKGRPSIHMPRWASRILLEVTDVRVERLQAITYEQAAAEGIHRDQRMWFATDAGGQAFRHPEQAFAHLWRQTGGDWDANPWVWAVEFERVVPADGM